MEQIKKDIEDLNAKIAAWKKIGKPTSQLLIAIGAAETCVNFLTHHLNLPAATPAAASKTPAAA